jgi:2-polyprenyl-3-methyl-5-hydroxy-6-metoxy-1,4-benzoquinol methylase
MATDLLDVHTANPGFVFETLLAYQRTAALRAAIEINLFGALGAGSAGAAELARRCSVSERGARILCDYLTTIGVIEKEGSTYRHSPTSATFLDPHSPASMASIVRLLGHPDILRPWEQLTEIVRSGRTSLPGEGTVEPENPVWVEFAHSMVPMVAPSLAPLAAAVLAHRPGPIRVLDIAAGHGMFGIEIARQNAAARIVALDWAPVLAVAKENARAAGVLERVEFLAGSAFDVEFGGPYDAVLLTNFLHHFDEPTCVALLKKVRAALAPRGITATLEFVPNEDRVTPVMAAQFSMMMLGTTATGDAYTLRDLERMHVAAGFTGLAPDAITVGPQMIVIGMTD